MNKRIDHQTILAAAVICVALVSAGAAAHAVQGTVTIPAGPGVKYVSAHRIGDVSSSSAKSSPTRVFSPKKINLKVGVKAPALAVAKWIKGKSVPNFKSGHVYVVEFWATWCKPCKEAMPHLTDLAKKYSGAATFIGIDIWEDLASRSVTDPSKAEQFVKNMGSKMGYTVAVDNKKGAVAKSWMESAGRSGIPTAFVVDKQGRIVWIGDPERGLSEALARAVAKAT